jgi:hypothetical protein
MACETRHLPALGRPLSHNPMASEHSDEQGLRQKLLILIKAKKAAVTATCAKVVQKKDVTSGGARQHQGHASKQIP